jgi:hypothetical protein
MQKVCMILSNPLVCGVVSCGAVNRYHQMGPGNWRGHLELSSQTWCAAGFFFNWLRRLISSIATIPWAPRGVPAIRKRPANLPRYPSLCYRLPVLSQRASHCLGKFP